MSHSKSHIKLTADELAEVETLTLTRKILRWLWQKSGEYRILRKLNYRSTTARLGRLHGRLGRGQSVLTCSGVLTRICVSYALALPLCSTL
jgi:hypothetical protein